MSALFISSLKARLLGAAFASLLALGTLTTAHAGPVLAQAETPNVTRATEVLPSAPQNAAQPVNIGNPTAATGPEKRVALVIGNSAYENVTALPNPANDAKAIGQFLNSAGFEVILATDLDHDEMVQVLQDFSARLTERGPNTVAFVYYAGHGLQIAGDNYLVPVDAKISTEGDVPNAALRLVDVMATLQAVPSRMRAVVIDACRNNPFQQLKDTGRGLAIVDAPNGSIVAYSTAPGTEAFDGEGKNSPYTTAFLQLGREQNVPIEQFFKKVRLVVNDVTEGKQTPWESSSLTSDFYFFGDTAVAATKTVDPATKQANASANRPVQVAQNLRTRTPREAYNMAIAEGSTEYYQEFVRIYPSDPFADHIRRLLAAKLVAVAWHGAVLANSPHAYKHFHSQYGDSPFGNMALRLADRPRMLSLYQPTKIMVAPQIAPQVKLTNFNGVNIGQGNNAPIGLGGNGNLFNKRMGSNGGFGNNGGLGIGGNANSGLGNGGFGGQKLGLPGPGQSGNPIGNVNNGGQVLNGQIRPGVDLAKGVKRFDKIDGGRLTTLPGQPATGTTGNGGRPLGGVGGPLVNKDGKVLNGGRLGNGGVNQATTGNGQPMIKRFDNPRLTNRQTTIVPQTSNQKPIVNRFQPGQRQIFNGSGNGGGGNGGGIQFRRSTSFGGSTMGGGSSGGGRFASGGTAFGWSFR